MLGARWKDQGHQRYRIRIKGTMDGITGFKGAIDHRIHALRQRSSGRLFCCFFCNQASPPPPNARDINQAGNRHFVITHSGRQDMLLHRRLVSVPGRKYSRRGCGIQREEMAGIIYPPDMRVDGRMLVPFSSQTDTYTQVL